MYQIVKEFIEENINIIENADYERFCSVWVDNYSPRVSNTETAVLHELFDVLRSVGLNFEEESRPYREQYVLQNMIDVIKAVRDSGLESIDLSSVVKALKSNLSVGLIAALALFKEAAKQIGLLMQTNLRIMSARCLLLASM